MRVFSLSIRERRGNGKTGAGYILNASDRCDPRRTLRINLLEGNAWQRRRKGRRSGLSPVLIRWMEGRESEAAWMLNDVVQMNLVTISRFGIAQESLRAVCSRVMYGDLTPTFISQWTRMQFHTLWFQLHERKLEKWFVLFFCNGVEGFSLHLSF